MCMSLLPVFTFTYCVLSFNQKLLRKENLDLKLTPYKVLATSTKHGEFILHHDHFLQFPVSILFLFKLKILKKVREWLSLFRALKPCCNVFPSPSLLPSALPSFSSFLPLPPFSVFLSSMFLCLHPPLSFPPSQFTDFLASDCMVLLGVPVAQKGLGAHLACRCHSASACCVL